MVPNVVSGFVNRRIDLFVRHGLRSQGGFVNPSTQALISILASLPGGVGLEDVASQPNI